MAATTFLSFGALGALLLATLAAYWRDSTRNPLFWIVISVAAAVPLAWVGLQPQSVWNAGFAVSLWLSVGATLVLFAPIAAATRSAWRLSPIIFPYLVALGILATVWSTSPGTPMGEGAISAWLPAHIFIALIAYGLVTLAAMAAAAVAAQEFALKRKHPNWLSRLLPSVVEAETLQMRLLMAGEAVLGAGLISGMALEYLSESRLIRPDHKTVFVLATFAVIGALIVGHLRSGLRGRLAARWVLVAYLLLSLGYPGVKFVTDVLLS
jgi:ABC-type uncharacterized transport system permease subunit